MTDNAIRTSYGDQLVMPGLGPAVGTVWQNVNTSAIGTVIHVEHRRRLWIDVRYDGRVTTVELAAFQANWQPYRFGADV